MIIRGELIIDKLSETYSSPACKLGRMVEEGKIIRLKRGLYEDDPDTPPYLVAQYLCEPSYISFDYALSWYEIIPEEVRNITCATMNKHKTKRFDTPLGTFIYSDIPADAFYAGIETYDQNGREFLMASPAKAVCDKLYKMPSTRSYRNLERLMFDDLRFDEDEIRKLDLKEISKYAALYHCTTITTLQNYLEERA